MSNKKQDKDMIVKRKDASDGWMSFTLFFLYLISYFDKIGYSNIIYGDLTLRINIFIIDYVQCLKKRKEKSESKIKACLMPFKQQQRFAVVVFLSSF